MAQLLEISIDCIVPSPNQPRKDFNPEELNELAESIRTVGLIQPITVRPSGSNYELIAGERRWRAAKLAGLSQIRAVIEPAAGQRSALMSLIENIQRSNLNPIEEALACRRLQRQHQLTQEELASKLGKKRSTIANLVRILSLPEEIQESIKRGEITLGHAKAILSTVTASKQRALHQQILKGQLTVRQAEQASKQPSSAPHKSTNPETAALIKQIARHLDVKVTWDRATLAIKIPSEDALFRVAEAMGVTIDV